MASYLSSGSGTSASESGDEWAWPGGLEDEEGAVMEGFEFRERVLRGDGQIDGEAFKEVGGPGGWRLRGAWAGFLGGWVGGWVAGWPMMGLSESVWCGSLSVERCIVLWNSTGVERQVARGVLL